jgi:hypothetical protein
MRRSLLGAAFCIIGFPSASAAWGQEPGLPPLPAPGKTTPLAVLPNTSTSPTPSPPVDRADVRVEPSESSRASADPEPMVWVHLNGWASGLRLEQDTDSAQHEEWKTACTAPCDTRISASALNRIAARAAHPSREFELRGSDGGRERIHVHGGWIGWVVLGWMGVGAGGGATLLGLGLASATLVGGTLDGAPPAALPLIAIGVPVALGGLLSLRLLDRTLTVSQDLTPPQAGTLSSDALKRTPTWKEPTLEQRALPPALGIPLLSGHF